MRGRGKIDRGFCVAKPTKVVEIEAGRDYRLDATLSARGEGLRKGHIDVAVILDGREHSLRIPYLALVR